MTKRLLLCTALASFGVAISAFGAVSVTIQAGPSVRHVGELIDWSAQVSGTPNPVFYRFRVRIPGSSEFRTIQDFGQEHEIAWTLAEFEGLVEMEVTARDRVTGQEAQSIATRTFESRVGASESAVNATAHPLVMLYSARACSDGSRMRVQVEREGATVFTTPWKNCASGRSINFYLAGLRPTTRYRAFHQIESSGRVASDAAQEFSTGQASGEYIEHTADSPLRGDQSVLLSAPLFPNRPTATDAEGRLIWYYPAGVSLLTRPQGGKFWGLIQSPGSKALQKIREFDLTGMTLRETNAERINDQIVPLGHLPISGFHHEVRELPDGKILALASAEKITTGLQGDGDDDAEVNLLSDVILVMDRDLNVLWHWDGFDHLDLRRRAILDEKCSIGACPPLYLTPNANDWTHANSVQLTPEGNFLVSLRHFDNLLKIDYANGAGSGGVIWEFGKDGHFQLENGDPDLWFSHQHDAQLLDENTILLFDNGNTRNSTDKAATSRGQVYHIDETARTARLTLNVDLGVYSFALGSAQRLASGSYHFGIGWILPDNTARSVEVTPDGQTVSSSTIARPAYRSFRLKDLYTAP